MCVCGWGMVVLLFAIFRGRVMIVKLDFGKKNSDASVLHNFLT